MASATRHQRCNSCLKRTNSWGRKSGYHWLVPYCFPATNPQRFRQYVAVALQENVQIGAADHGYSEALYLSDPENNGIEIYWDKPEEVWDIRPNGEIIGVTEELDGDSLAAEADGHWLGISEGSKIGHIHLKVADLDATETFYKNLGFGLKSNFGQQAKFLQRSQYHHHIGTNTWSGKQLPTIQENQFGLENYTFRLPTAADLEIVKPMRKKQSYILLPKIIYLR